MPIYIDKDPENADWIKRRWNLPPYKSKEFMRLLAFRDIDIEHFKTLPVYKHAVKTGLIVDDKWAEKESGEE